MTGTRIAAMLGQKQNAAANRLSLAAAMLVVFATVVAMSLYATAPLRMTERPDYRSFPPFNGDNRLDIKHLGAEYNAISVALINGRGFADPFRAHTGPTAWMPPMFSWILAALRWDADGDITYVQAAVVILQDLTLIATGWLVIGLASRTGSSVWLATLLYIGGLCYYFRLSFQFIHDCWIVLAALDVLIAGLVWVRPLQASWPVAAGWGVTGGLIALTSPAVAFIWGLAWCVSAVAAVRDRVRLHQPLRIGRPLVAALAVALTVSPWVARNYQVFGRFIPIKSNLAFELYQSQCVQDGGVLHDAIWQSHPNSGGNSALREYASLGEMAFMDRKWEQFGQAVRANPGDFVERVWNRFLEATLVYVPFNTQDEVRHPDMTWYIRLIYPLPFVCAVGLLVTSPWRRLSRGQWIVIGVYVAYVTPYIIVSYYDRYKVPMVGIEAIMLVWGVDRFLNLGAAESAATAELSRLRLGGPAKRQAALADSLSVKGSA